MNEENKSKSEVEVEELKKRGAKLKASNDRSRARLTEVLSIAEKVLVKTVHWEGYHPGQYGQDYRELGKAICEIRTICKKDLSGDFPDYEWMAGMMTSEYFDPNRLAEELAAKASEKPVDYPTFYTPGWLCELAKKLAAKTGEDVHGLHGLSKESNPCESVKSVDDKVSLMPPRIPGGIDGTEPAERKHSMDFGKFHVTRAAIKGRTVLTFNRKADPDNQGQSRQIVATIMRYNGGVSISVMDYQEGRGATPRRIMSSDMYGVGFSRSEKIAYTAVRKLIKETQRRRITRKRKAAAKRAAATQELIKKELA